MPTYYIFHAFLKKMNPVLALLDPTTRTTYESVFFVVKPSRHGLRPTVRVAAHPSVVGIDSEDSVQLVRCGVSMKFANRKERVLQRRSLQPVS